MSDRDRDNRETVLLAQRRLSALGLYAGAVDGWGGPATRDALVRALAVPETRAPEAAARPVWPAQDAVESVFGPAGGPDCTAGVVSLPMPFLLAWDRSARIERFSCHRLVAAPLTAIFAEAVRHYGPERFAALGLNLFGGCYNYRQMRGGSRLSMHAWGIAVDLDPERNQLAWGRDRAAFARPEYEAFWRIVEDRGALSLGRARNRDWMHFQFATI